MPNISLLWKVIKRSGASTAATGFLVVYLLCAFAILLVEPNITRYSDALWFLWAVASTTGLGDITAVTLVGRIAAIICSLYAVVTTAIITGVIVDYYNESRQLQFDMSMVEFMDKLERLPELDHDELVDMANRVKEFRK